jgi:4,5-dihydroxyphthalate decarboxylase
MAKTKLKLRLLIGEYESTRALREGEVKAEGLDLEFPHYPGHTDIHWQVADNGVADVGEFNAPAYVAATSRGFPLTAIPVFLHRRFRHGFIFVNTASGVRDAKDLIGKRVASQPIFQPAAAVWIRGLLENDYGVPHRSITWVTEQPEIVKFEGHPDLKIEIAAGRSADDLLEAGEVAAIIAPNVPRGMRQGRKDIVNLWPDYKDREVAYFKRTGIFPIMHVTTIRKEIVESEPWVVQSLMDAFERSKRAAYRRLVNPRVVPLAWYRSYWDEERELLGPDPWQYGVTPANRRNMETIATYVHQQTMSDRLVPVEEMFPQEALSWEAPRQ